jgi:cytochrome c biogenesis protein ResB
MAFQNVFILGASGQVGTEVVKQIWAVDGVNRGHQNPTRIVGIANSTRFQLSPGGIMMPEVITRDSMRSLLSEENRTQSYDSHQQILEAVRTMGMEWEIVFVDVTADGQTMIDFIKMLFGALLTELLQQIRSQQRQIWELLKR